MLIEKFSMGVGDRFGHQGKAQLAAFAMAKELGIRIAPVWNKSKREHILIGSDPGNVRMEADEAVRLLGWDGAYYVDADHIGLKTVGEFIEHSNFFTIDVADYIGKTPDPAAASKFIDKCLAYSGELKIPGLSSAFEITPQKIENIAERYLTAIMEAGGIYRRIVESKGAGNFVTEVSFDENHEPQTPEEIFFILFGLSIEGVPVQTIAPKFSGRFNKGVDYVGDVDLFAKEFEEDVLVLKYCAGLFGLPENLKLSVHSGSDKFSLYPIIAQIVRKHDAGLHLKTAGTTWLEELIGLAEAGGEALEIAKQIYKESFARKEELMVPYATVVDIDNARLPHPEDVAKWGSAEYTNALRHDQKCPEFNIHFRQLLHLGYKIAAEMGARYTDALVKYNETIARNVTGNIYERHMKPLFIDK